MMLREVVLLLMVVVVVVLMVVLLLLVAPIVVSTMCTVRGGRFVGNRSGEGRDGGVVLLLRWGSIAACRWMHGLVRLSWT